MDKLEQLRAALADLQKRAAAKIAEVKDGLKPDEIRAIEDDHKKLLEDVAAKQREIDTAEAAEREQLARGNQEHAWSRGDIQKITARAIAFGLDASVATEIMADDK